MLFDDYIRTNIIYHVVSLEDLEQSLKYGIGYNDKKTYNKKYEDFHEMFDNYKSKEIPSWVIRKNAIFASMNFKNNHIWHSHTALLKVKVNTNKCWICNENIANYLYESFILKQIKGFDAARKFMNKYAKDVVEDYWKSSCSFIENLNKRNDKKEEYDAEVLIMDHIPPANIECYKIISDHRIMSPVEWEKFFLSNNTKKYSRC